MRAINLKYQLQHGMKNLNFEYIFKKHGEKTVNP